MKRDAILALCAMCAVFAAKGETNLVHEVIKRTHVSAYADIETAYWARGVISDKKPYSA